MDVHRRFVDALRECLGLEPIYNREVGRHLRGEKLTLRRFYRGVHSDDRLDGRTPRAPTAW